MSAPKLNTRFSSNVFEMAANWLHSKRMNQFLLCRVHFMRDRSLLNGKRRTNSIFGLFQTVHIRKCQELLYEGAFLNGIQCFVSFQLAPCEHALKECLLISTICGVCIEFRNA